MHADLPAHFGLSTDLIAEHRKGQFEAHYCPGLGWVSKLPALKSADAFGDMGDGRTRSEREACAYEALRAEGHR